MGVQTATVFFKEKVGGNGRFRIFYEYQVYFMNNVTKPFKEKDRPFHDKVQNNGSLYNSFRGMEMRHYTVEQRFVKFAKFLRPVVYITTTV